MRGLPLGLRAATLVLVSLSLAHGQVGLWTTLFESKYGNHPVNPAPAFCESSRRFFFFGGLTTTGRNKVKYSDDLYIFDTADGKWSNLTRLSDQVAWPSKRAYGRLECWQETLLLYGGSHDGTALQDIWVFHVSNMTWKLASTIQEQPFAPIAPNTFVSFAFDSVNGYLYYPLFLEAKLSLWQLSVSEPRWKRVYTDHTAVFSVGNGALPASAIVVMNSSRVMIDLMQDLGWDVDVVTGEAKFFNFTSFASVRPNFQPGTYLSVRPDMTLAFFTPKPLRSRADPGHFFAWDLTRNTFRPIIPPRGIIFEASRFFVSVSEQAVYQVYQHYPDVTIKRYLIGCANGCNGSECVSDAYCECSNSTTGPDCSVPCVECQHGTCYPSKFQANTSVCDCDTNYAGASCADYFPCRGRVKEQPGNQTDPYSCECLFNVQSPPLCKFCGPCRTGVCDRISSTCVCPPEFDGDNCEIDRAAPEMKVLDCSNSTLNGTIVKDFDGYSWCRYTNLGITPLRLPPPSDANTTAIGPPKCPTNASATDFCAVVTAVSTMGWIKPDEKVFGRNSAFSLVLAGFADGQFVVADFLNESHVGKWRVGDRPVTFLGSGLAYDLGIVLASDGVEFAIVASNSNATADIVLRDSWLSFGEHNVSIVSVDFAVASQNGAWMYPMALLKYTEDNKIRYSLRIREYHLSNVSSGAKLINTAEWRIISPVDGDVFFHIGVQPLTLKIDPRAPITWADPTCGFSVFTYRFVVLVHDASSAFIIRAPEFPLSESGVYDLDLAPSLLYRTNSTSKIVSANFYPECFLSPSGRSAALSAAFTLRSAGSRTDLMLVRFEELTLHEELCSSSNLSLAEDVISQRSGSGCDSVNTAQCNPETSYFNGTTCVPRSILSIPLPNKPSKVVRRFIGNPMGHRTPSAFQEPMVNTKWNASLPSVMQSFMYNAFFVASEDGTRLDIIGVQQDMRHYPSVRYVTASMNSFDFPASLDAWTVTANGQHIFLATARHKWELDSQARLVEICRARETDESARKLFAQYEPLCSTPFGAPKPASYADFVFMVSMCAQNTYCPEFARVPPNDITMGLNVTDAPLGFYTPAPGLLRECEPGFVCRNGKRSPCPRGFICPSRGMTVPEACHSKRGTFNVTCFEEGLSAYKPCPAGFVCLSVDYPPVPAPAGRYINPARPEGPGNLCPGNGSYCPLGATDPPPLCPAGFYCPNPAQLYPRPCPTAYDANFTQVGNWTSYCPNGTAEPSPCPSGHYCPVPWELLKCDLGDYCPKGSQKRQPCPVGRLCSFPSENIVCPAGYFCPEGSYEARKCSPLAMCAEGSSTQRGWLALSLEFVILALALVAYFTVRYIRGKRQKASLMASLAQKRQKNRFLPQKELEPEVEMGTDNEDEPLLSAPSSSRQIDLPDRPLIELEFKNIVLTVAGDKVVLDGVSGAFKPGQLSAILGPSGAGKSSLVSVLCGDSTIASGDILINGAKDNPTRFKSVIGLVPQEDVMHNTLTVSEILRFNAAVRLPRTTTDAEREDLVQDILEVLKLKKIKHSKIGTESERGISGGERKRVNIGMELAADPSLLFLDEPTSGLDSASAVQAIRCLKTIASVSQMTVVCVIHQPRVEVFELFDSVLFLAPGGRTVFQGDVRSAERYFENLGYPLPTGANPADFYIDLIAACANNEPLNDLPLRDLPHEWSSRNQQEEDGSVASSAPRVRKSDFHARDSAGFFKQLWLFFVRSLLLQMRDLRTILLNIFLVFISGLLLGFVYTDATYVGPASDAAQKLCPSFIKKLCGLPQEDTYVLQFALMNMALGLTAVAGALPTFGAERVTFWRESRAGMSTAAFFIGKDLAALPMIVIPPLFLISIFYFLTAPESNFFAMFAILLAVQFVCVSVGYTISLLLAPSSALLAGVVFVVVSTLFSGANPTLAKLRSFGFPAVIMASVSFSRWSTEALYSTLLEAYKDRYDVQTGLEYWGFDMQNYPLVDFLALAGLALGLRLLAFLILFVFHRNKKVN